MKTRRARRTGFTLVELAVVLALVGLLLGGLMYTLSAQTEQRARAETQRRLDEIKELLLAFAIVNGRLPCPAAPGTSGVEAEVAAGTGQCANYLNGFVPAQAIGFQPVDDAGYAFDAWGNRIRYALAQTATNPSGAASCAGPASPAFSATLNLRNNGIGCAPANLVVCDATQNTNSATPSCGTWAAAGDAKAVTNQLTVVAVVFSTGKNTTEACATCVHEAENTDGDGLFVWHDVRPDGAVGGAYDDMMTWLPVGVLYGRMVAAGVLP
jgi:prepilin-type N-terminal cleavage/methylation domain-containing protein